MTQPSIKSPPLIYRIVQILWQTTATHASITSVIINQNLIKIDDGIWHI